MATAPAHWLADMAKMDEALRVHIVTTDDGFSYISDAAPAALVSAYRGLVQMGYANGWMP